MLDFCRRLYTRGWVTHGTMIIIESNDLIHPSAIRPLACSLDNTDLRKLLHLIHDQIVQDSVDIRINYNLCLGIVITLYRSMVRMQHFRTAH